jgi:hypothetical protein
MADQTENYLAIKSVSRAVILLANVKCKSTIMNGADTDHDMYENSHFTGTPQHEIIVGY